MVVAATKVTIAMEALVVQEMMMGSRKATEIRINLKKKKLRRMPMLSHAVQLQLRTMEAILLHAMAGRGFVTGPDSSPMCTYIYA